MLGPVKIINLVEFSSSELDKSKSFGTYVPNGRIFSKTGCLPFLTINSEPSVNSGFTYEDSNAIVANDVRTSSSAINDAASLINCTNSFE